jgi:signal transduction histidine kinase
MRVRRRNGRPTADPLVDHILRAIDRDREDIAGRLHDGPQQLMTAIRLLASGAQHALREGQVEDAEHALERLQELAVQAGDELRRLSGTLHPVALEQGGLVGSLAGLTEWLEGEYGVETRLSTREPSVRQPDRDRAVYMIARGAALSAARYGASVVEIVLTFDSRAIVLTVTGVGCPAHDPAVEALLRARAGRIGGTLDVGADPAVVRMTAPVA